MIMDGALYRVTWAAFSSGLNRFPSLMLILSAKVFEDNWFPFIAHSTILLLHVRCDIQMTPKKLECKQVSSVNLNSDRLSKIPFPPFLWTDPIDAVTGRHHRCPRGPRLGGLVVLEVKKSRRLVTAKTALLKRPKWI